MKKQILILSLIAIAVILMGAYFPRTTLGVLATMVVPDTTSHGVDTWIPIASAFNNTVYGGFELTATPAIKYIHDEPHLFRSEANTNVSTDTPLNTFWIGLRRNGTLVDSFSTFLKTAGEPLPLYDFSVAMLYPNDELQLVWKAEKACTAITTSYKTSTLRAD